MGKVLEWRTCGDDGLAFGGALCRGLRLSRHCGRLGGWRRSGAGAGRWRRSGRCRFQSERDDCLRVFPSGRALNEHGRQDGPGLDLGVALTLHHRRCRTCRQSTCEETLSEAEADRRVPSPWMTDPERQDHHVTQAAPFRNNGGDRCRRVAGHVCGVLPWLSTSLLTGAGRLDLLEAISMLE